MKRPKKKNAKTKMIGYDDYMQDERLIGYNQALTDMDKYLPSEKEILKDLEIYQNIYWNIRMPMKGIDKTISKRIQTISNHPITN